jgi:hypothetical protein
MGKEPRDHKRPARDNDYEKKDRRDWGDRGATTPEKKINDVTDWDRAPHPSRDDDKKK